MDDAQCRTNRIGGFVPSRATSMRAPQVAGQGAQLSSRAKRGISLRAPRRRRRLSASNAARRLRFSLSTVNHQLSTVNCIS